MSSQNDFSIDEDTFRHLNQRKSNDGFEKKSWNEWFLYVLGKTSNPNSIKDQIFSIIDESFYKNWFDSWVTNFALNLSDIWKYSSAKELEIKQSKLSFKNYHPCIIIGRGPSLKKNNHLQILSESNYRGSIICTDGALISALEYGVTPEKFPNFYVTTVDGGGKIIRGLYEHDLVDKFGPKINGVFSILTHPSVLTHIKNVGIKIHWIHPLFDYNEGKKSFNKISATMIRAKKSQGLPAIQTGGNVGTSAWFIAWRILKCNVTCLIGIDHGWAEDDPWDLIMSHGGYCETPKFNMNDKIFNELFPKIHNPEFNTNCIQDPVFQYYSSALKEFISRSPDYLKTINATEGGSIFGNKIHCMKFKNFLETYSDIV